MEQLFTRSANPKTPQLQFDAASGQMLIRGRSIPENSIAFYQDLFDWLDAYASSPAASTQLTVNLEYFNTSSSKCLLDIFRKLEPLGQQVTVLWMYDAEDDDMLESGQDYKDLLKGIDFQLKEKEA